MHIYNNTIDYNLCHNYKCKYDKNYICELNNVYICHVRK